MTPPVPTPTHLLCSSDSLPPHNKRARARLPAPTLLYVLINICTSAAVTAFVVQPLSPLWDWDSWDCPSSLGPPWTTAHQALLSSIISWSFSKLQSIELVMPSDCLIPCRPLLLHSSNLPILRVFSNESGVQSIWASASASVLPMNFLWSDSMARFSSYSSFSLLAPANDS